jgi:hypothetical protein
MTFQTTLHVSMEKGLPGHGWLGCVQYRDRQESANRLFSTNQLAPFALFKLFT